MATILSAPYEAELLHTGISHRQVELIKVQTEVTHHFRGLTQHGQTYLSSNQSIHHFYIPQDNVPALGYKTYFVRVSTNESVVKGAKITTLSPTKKILRSVKEDIPLENEVIIHDSYTTMYVYYATPTLNVQS